MADGDVHVPTMTVKNELNLSTVALALAMSLQLGGLVYYAGRFTSLVDDLSSGQNALNIRMKAVEDVSTKYDNLAYRLTVREQAAAARDKSIEDLRTALALQSADIRVIREILTRIDKQRIAP